MASKKCACGCGRAVNDGSTFRQGHDQKLRSKLIKSGNKKALRAHGWPVPKK